jgi:SSS family solute:Na+ symporter
MLIGFVVVPVVSFISPKLDAAKVDAIFTCYDKQAVVTVKKVLVDEEEEQSK